MIENEIFIIFVSNLKLRIENIIKKDTKIFYKNLGFIQNLRTSKLIALSLKVKLWNIVYKNFLKVYFNYNVKEKIKHKLLHNSFASVFWHKGH